MNKTSRRHTNGDFSRATSLILADVLMSGILGMIFLGIPPKNDTGLMVNLAPYYYETEDTIKIASSHILHLAIDSNSQLLIDDTIYSFSDLESKIHSFVVKSILNGTKSYIWIRVSRNSRYRYYIRLRDIIKSAEKGIANDLSIRRFGTSFSDDMPLKLRRQIKEEISLSIIEEDETGKPYFEF